MAQAVSEEIWQELSTLEFYDGAMREHFAAGLPIDYSEDDTPADLLIEEYPDGRRELVRHHRAGGEVLRIFERTPAASGVLWTQRSGKSTLAERFLKERLPNINPDAIATQT